jgi:hypothetical protein
MSSTRSRSGSAKEEQEVGHWTTETLPLSLRKELLERELSKLGLRKSGQGGSAREAGGGPPQQQAPGAGDSHPHADGKRRRD